MRRFPPGLSAAGYAPAPEPERVRTSFTAIGQDWMNDISFPSAQLDPRAQVMGRNTGDLCRHCMLPPSVHQTPASAAGYEPLGPQNPGVHPSVDDGSAHNAADELPGGRLAEFGVGRGTAW